MTLNPKIHDDIRRDEAWLRSVSADPVACDAERIKLSVRVAMDESWLAGQVAETAPVGLQARLRERIASELSGMAATSAGGAEIGRSCKGSRSPARLPRWASAIVGMAACLMLAVLVGPFAPSTPASFSAVDAFLVYDDSDEFVDSLATLDADVWDLEYSLGLTAFHATEDDSVDELNDDIDLLFSNSWATADTL
jgi:hypothetical protein